MATKASDAMLMMLSLDIRSRMIEDQKRRHVAGLISFEELCAFISDVRRVEAADQRSG